MPRHESGHENARVSQRRYLAQMYAHANQHARTMARARRPAHKCARVHTHMCLRAVLARAPRDLAFTYVNLFCAHMCLHPCNEKMHPSTCVSRAQTCVCTRAYLRRCTQLCVYTRTARRARAREFRCVCIYMAYIRVCDVTDTYVSPRAGRHTYVYLSVRKRKWPCGRLPFLLQTHMRVRSDSENVGQHAWLSHTCASDARRNVYSLAWLSWQKYFKAQTQTCIYSCAYLRRRIRV